MTGTNWDLFTHKSVPVIFEPPCIMLIQTYTVRVNLIAEERITLRIKKLTM